MHVIFRLIKKILPRGVINRLLPFYHYLLAFFSALYYRFPSKHLIVIAITGTKGKTSTSELINAIFEEAGYSTALLNTVRFKIGTTSSPNLLKMTMPGRFFVQKFLRNAVTSKCSHAIIEMTSEGARQFRHRFIDLNALVFTNIAPEHIESHGSFDKYLAAKLSIAHALASSPKKDRMIVANTDDPHGPAFLAIDVPRKIGFSLFDGVSYSLTENGVSLTYHNTEIKSSDPGIITVYNILAAVTLATVYKIPLTTIKQAVEKFKGTRGRLEKIDAGQKFPVVIDYAHTLESLRGVYEAFAGKKRICVFGSTGGGRDIWKRPQIGALADTFCDTIILTDEDPYDEDPQKIVNDIVLGIKIHTPTIEMDRRKAIFHGLKQAGEDSVVLITGKGTDPYIMGKKGSKQPWDDATVAREELKKLHHSS